MRILIIAGHQNVQYNSITSLHGNTGTVGELEINVRIADRLSSLLRGRGFEVVQSDANANDNPAITGTDFNLAIALHCDMDTPNDNGGGMIASGDPSVDTSWQESARIRDVIKSVYFDEVKMVDKNYTTTGMTQYYMWRYLSSKTPCVLIEMGQAKDPHDSVLLGNTELIAGALSKAICQAFGVPETTTTTTNTTTSTSSSTTTTVLDASSEVTALLQLVKAVVSSKWTWIGRDNNWKLRLSQLRALLPE